MNEKLFPTIMAVLYIGQTVVLLSKCEWKQAAYWIGALLIVWSVSF
jgi:hypothetical protein